MLPAKRIHKRKAKKLLGYFLMSGGLFCVVFAMCMSVFFLTRKQPPLYSPLANLQKAVFASAIDNTIMDHILELCHKYNLSCQNISIKDETEIDLTVNNHLVIIARNKNIDKEIASLQLTIRALTMEGKDYRGLDFRYDRPVISY